MKASITCSLKNRWAIVARWAIWKTRNKAYFGGKLLTNPDEIIIKIFFVTMAKLF